jgi:hypothetical protein
MKVVVQFLLATAGVAAFFCGMVWVIVTYGVAGLIFALGVMPLILLVVGGLLIAVLGLLGFLSPPRGGAGQPGASSSRRR